MRLTALVVSCALLAACLSPTEENTPVPPAGAQAQAPAPPDVTEPGVAAAESAPVVDTQVAKQHHFRSPLTHRRLRRRQAFVR